MTLPLALVTLISAFGSSFQYGYNVSVINSPAPVGWDVDGDGGGSIAAGWRRSVVTGV